MLTACGVAAFHVAQSEELRVRSRKWKKANHKKWGNRQERVSRVFFDHMDRDRQGLWVEYVGSLVAVPPRRLACLTPVVWSGSCVGWTSFTW